MCVRHLFGWVARLAAVGAFALLMALPAQAASLRSDTSPIFVFGQPSMLIPGAWSTLTRREDEVSMRLSTTDLVPRTATTVWWVIFNHPDKCTHGGGGFHCGDGDVFMPNSPTEPSVMYAAGRVASRGGTDHFSASLEVGDTSGCISPAESAPELFPCNHGLVNVRGADIHLVVRTHGAVIPDVIDQQLGSFNGGCPPNTCDNIQASVHEAK